MSSIVSGLLMLVVFVLNSNARTVTISGQSEPAVDILLEVGEDIDGTPSVYGEIEGVSFSFSPSVGFWDGAEFIQVGAVQDITPVTDAQSVTWSNLWLLDSGETVSFTAQYDAYGVHAIYDLSSSPTIAFASEIAAWPGAELAFGELPFALAAGSGWVFRATEDVYGFDTPLDHAGSIGAYRDGERLFQFDQPWSGIGDGGRIYNGRHVIFPDAAVSLKVFNPITSATRFDPSLSISSTSYTYDARILQQVPTTNYGTLGTISLQDYASSSQRARTLMDWNINSALQNAGYVPALVESFTSASLTLTVSVSGWPSSRTAYFYGLSSSFTENSVTWNTAPSVSGSAIPFTIPASPSSVTISGASFTQMINDIRDGTYYGIRLQTSESNFSEYVDFDSSEGTTPPVLELSFDYGPFFSTADVQIVTSEIAGKDAPLFLPTLFSSASAPADVPAASFTVTKTNMLRETTTLPSSEIKVHSATDESVIAPYGYVISVSNTVAGHHVWQVTPVQNSYTEGVHEFAINTIDFGGGSSSSYDDTDLRETVGGWVASVSDVFPVRITADRFTWASGDAVFDAQGNTHVRAIGRALSPTSATYAIHVYRSAESAPVAPTVFSYNHESGIDNITIATESFTEFGQSLERHYAQFTIEATRPTGIYTVSILNKETPSSDTLHLQSFSITHNATPVVDTSALATQSDITALGAMISDSITRQDTTVRSMISIVDAAPAWIDSASAGTSYSEIRLVSGAVIAEEVTFFDSLIEDTTSAVGYYDRSNTSGIVTWTPTVYNTLEAFATAAGIVLDSSALIYGSAD